MTLNITVLAENCIYQSADFRLTDSSTGQVITDRSMKVVGLQYHDDFSGFVTYTGVGGWGRRDMAEWVTGWLSGKSDLTVDQVAEILREQGSNLLRRIENRTGMRHRHTFVLAGFARGGAEAAVISNFEEASGKPFPHVAGALSVCRVRGRKRPQVIVTGMKPAVARDRRRALTRLVETASNEPERIRQTLASLNKTAAQSANAHGLISEECTVISTDPTGRGFQSVSTGSDVDLRSVLNGLVLPDLRRIAESLGLGRPILMGSSFATNSTRTIDREECVLDVVADDSAQYSLIEIMDQRLNNLVGVAVGHDGSALGVGAHDGDRPGFYRIWARRLDGSLELLPQSVSGNRSMDILKFGTAALSTTNADGHAHAVRWASGKFEPLDGPDDYFSHARAITNSGLVAGWVGTDPTDRSQAKDRPAVWDQDGRLFALLGLPGDWGTAIDVNDQGVAVLWVYQGVEPNAYLWEPGTDDVRLIGEENQRGVIPVSMNNGGTILGFARHAGYGIQAVVSHFGGQWSRLDVEPGWHPTALGGDGTVVGHVAVDGFARPWLRRPDGELVMLPYTRYHHCRPAALNEPGDIVGDASTDHGSHAVMWRLSP